MKKSWLAGVGYGPERAAARRQGEPTKLDKDTMACLLGLLKLEMKHKVLNDTEAESAQAVGQRPGEFQNKWKTPLETLFVKPYETRYPELLKEAKVLYPL